MSDAPDVVLEGLAGLAELFDPRHRTDPYPLYAHLRRTRPVWQPDERFFVLSRHRDCSAVLRDPRFGHPDDVEFERHRAGRARPGRGMDDDRPPVRSFLGLNPPDHTRLRRLVSRAFTPRRVEALVPRVRELTAELLASCRDHDPVDLVRTLASPLPVSVICELFGVDHADRPRVVGWSHALARALDPAFLVPAAERHIQATARAEFGSYLLDVVAARRASPGTDLLSGLVAVMDTPESSPERMSEPELVATCILLLIAGHETTTSLIANGVLALLRNRRELERLRRQPGLIPSAVEELLRYDPPVQLTARTALTAAEVGDTTVPEGSSLLLLLASANRDPEVYDDPDRLDVGRTPAPHLAFGLGIHFCLGAPLARVEARIALEALTRDIDAIELAGEPAWKENAILRGVGRLDVHLAQLA